MNYSSIISAMATRISDGLENVVTGLGTSRDKATYSRYGQIERLSDEYLDRIYRGSWLAKHIVDIPAEDMTREWYSVVIDDDSKGSNQKKITKYEMKLCLRERVTTALKWARLYGGSLLLLGMANDEDLSKPLDIDKASKDSFAYVRVFDRTQIIPNSKLDEDLNSENFGLPIDYKINGTSRVIHPSRVVRFDGDKIPDKEWKRNKYWHDSVIQGVIQDLMSYDTITAAVTSMIFETNLDVIKSPDMAVRMSTKEGEQQIIKRFLLSQLMKSFNRTLLIDSTEEYDKKGNNFGGVADIWTQYRINAAGAARIPVSRLFGESAKGLNATGDGDLRNYYDDESNCQETDLRPGIEKINRLVCASVFGKFDPDMELVFNPLWQIEPVEQADIDLKNAQRDHIYITDSVITAETVATDLMERSTYKNLTQEDIDALAELDNALPEDDTINAGGQPPGI